MAENLTSETGKSLIDDLRKIEVFSDLPQEHLAWLAEKFEETHFQPGEIMAREGEPAEYLIVVLEGEIRMQRSSDPDSPIYRGFAGQVTGLLPYSRLTHYPGTGRAVLPTRMLRLHKDLFPEMLQRMPQLGQRLVTIMADRIRETTKLETQRDKLMALGKLSAGLAHELNNPAAAAQRATASLRETLETVRDASIRLARHALSIEQRELILHFERKAGQYTAAIPADALAQSDREERITTWLEARRVPDAWKIENSTKRISDLVRAIKEYSYMDQAAMQEIDLHQGLESTLTILHHRLKGGIRVVREYDKNLPRICAFGGELNQIWTNLLDNAIEAMQGKGELRVRTARELDRVLVEIQDTGPGIRPDVLPHIFEPFFTTKSVGEGTGLGLDTVCRIVRSHHGEIRVSSQPGDTRFQVHLPIVQPKAQSPTE
jgi:signal transduction histidine kinase